MNKPYMCLQPTEIALLQAASRIYAARLAADQVPGGGEVEAEVAIEKVQQNTAQRR